MATERHLQNCVPMTLTDRNLLKETTKGTKWWIVGDSLTKRFCLLRACDMGNVPILARAGGYGLARVDRIWEEEKEEDFDTLFLRARGWIHWFHEGAVKNG